MILLCCTHQNQGSRLVTYINAEKKLRTRVTPEQGLQDSILGLREKYHLDLDKEIAKMKNNPEALKKLLEALAGKE